MTLHPSAATKNMARGEAECHFFVAARGWSVITILYPDRLDIRAKLHRQFMFP